MSFVADKIIMDGLTFDDVLLVPSYSEVIPVNVSLATKFSRNIELKIPFVTAAMDTVTEAKMAIAIAREGGIGVIHKNMSIEEQARQVAIVKRAENGMIYDPITINRDASVKDALDLMAEYHIGGEGSAKEYIDAAKAAGTNVIDNVMYVKCGKIPFLGKVTDDEKAAAAKWAEDIIAAMK